MKFWVIADKRGLDLYYDFETKQTEEWLDTTRLLPAEGIAEEYIKNHLTYKNEKTLELHTDYKAIEIEFRDVVFKDNELVEATVIGAEIDEWKEELEEEEQQQKQMAGNL